MMCSWAPVESRASAHAAEDRQAEVGWAQRGFFESFAERGGHARKRGFTGRAIAKTAAVRAGFDEQRRHGGGSRFRLRPEAVPRWHPG
jgi:hypothetical protein